ncbi:MAG: hypothetical protein J3K34DRAFT_442216 [Monoraphidium minutum]|nr:MAG: hypothetical protein J3K34DRAFT_442216 [Monoraphidium minutum]
MWRGWLTPPSVPSHDWKHTAACRTRTDDPLPGRVEPRSSARALVWQSRVRSLNRRRLHAPTTRALAPDCAAVGRGLNHARRANAPRGGRTGTTRRLLGAPSPPCPVSSVPVPPSARACAIQGGALLARTPSWHACMCAPGRPRPPPPWAPAGPCAMLRRRPLRQAGPALSEPAPPATRPAAWTTSVVAFSLLAVGPPLNGGD